MFSIVMSFQYALCPKWFSRNFPKTFKTAFSKNTAGGTLLGRFRFWAPTRFLQVFCPRYDPDVNIYSNIIIGRYFEIGETLFSRLLYFQNIYWKVDTVNVAKVIYSTILRWVINLYRNKSKRCFSKNNWVTTMTPYLLVHLNKKKVV